MDLPRVAIPSYKRVQMIQTHTLKFLADIGYPSEKIHIFVANQDEYNEYRSALPVEYKHIIIGVLGLAPQRNFISDYFDEGEYILQIDDDVKGLKLKNKELSHLDLFRSAINRMVREGIGLFGVLPNDDGRKMTDKWTLDLAHILGSFFILQNRRAIRIQYSEKEDYERCIKYFLADGKILRYRGAGVNTLYMRNPGGLQVSDRRPAQEEATAALCAAYPQMVKRRTKNDTPDLTLNWRYQKKNFSLPTPKIECCCQP